MAALKLASVLVMCMVVAAPIASAAISCGDVTSNLAPCINYLKSGGAVPADCCGGVTALNDMASTTPDRQQACKCLQQTAKGTSDLNPDYAASLPGKCGVNIPYKISTSTDCARSVSCSFIIHHNGRWSRNR